jgi:hypothetical protein
MGNTITTRPDVDRPIIANLAQGIRPPRLSPRNSV